MSVITRSQYVYSERKNNVYKPQDTINFYIPPSISLINTKNTYMVFDLKMTGLQYKAAVSQKAGIYSLFRSITISFKLSSITTRRPKRRRTLQYFMKVSPTRCT